MRYEKDTRHLENQPIPMVAKMRLEVDSYIATREVHSRGHLILESRSNEDFDTSLRARNPSMGIRDLDDLEDLAGRNGMVLARTYAMPANNLLIVWERKER